MSFLIPIGVVCYAAIGGLKATFTTSYMHTVIIYIVCLVLMFKVKLLTSASALAMNDAFRVKPGKSVHNTHCPMCPTCQMKMRYVFNHT